MSKLKCKKFNSPQTTKRMDDYKIGQETDTFPICNLNYPDYLRIRQTRMHRQPHRLRVQSSVAQGPRQTGQGNEREGGRAQCVLFVIRQVNCKVRYATLQVQ